MTNLRKLISRESAVVFAPTSQEEIAVTSSFLEQNNLAPLPLEYIEFLKNTNGFTYNGIEFFGTKTHHREEKGYIFPDIITINKHYIPYKYFFQKVIIGRLSEGLIVYNRKENSFSITDRIKLRHLIELDDIEELLSLLVHLCDNTLANNRLQ